MRARTIDQRIHLQHPHDWRQTVCGETVHTRRVDPNAELTCRRCQHAHDRTLREARSAE